MLGTSKAHGHDKEQNKIRSFGVISCGFCVMLRVKRGGERRGMNMLSLVITYTISWGFTCGECWFAKGYLWQYVDPKYSDSFPINLEMGYISSWEFKNKRPTCPMALSSIPKLCCLRILGNWIWDFLDHCANNFCAFWTKIFCLFIFYC